MQDLNTLLWQSAGFAIGGGAAYLLKLLAEWLFFNLRTWLCFTAETQNYSLHLAISRSYNWTRVEILSGGSGKARCQLNVGSYLLWKPVPTVVRVKRSRKKGIRLILTTLRFWGERLKLFIADCSQPNMADNDQVCILKYKDNNWNSANDVTVNPKAMVLASGQWEEITTDLAVFKSRRQWYSQRGINYRRGYLFYGPPGTGKTSLAAAIASLLGGDLALCQAVKFKNLIAALDNVSWLDRAVLLIDDIDELLTKEDFQLGELLSALDNLGASGCVVVMTCNDPSRLPAKLVRPGRIDRRWKLDFADDDQVVRTFNKFFPEKPLTANKFLAECRKLTRSITPAELHECLVSAHSVKDALQVKTYFENLDHADQELKKKFN